MDLDKVLDKVRKLIRKAEDASVTPEEAVIFTQGANDLMLKYAIEEAMLDMDLLDVQRSKPGTIDIDLTSDLDVLSYMANMAIYIARHVRCRIRNYTSWNGEMKCWQSRVYGFESDLRYFEILYTTLRLHMLGVLRPSIDPAKSLDENCYVLHNAGYNWLEIASMYGWEKKGYFALDDKRRDQECWTHKETGEKKTNWQLGSMHKRAYQKACKTRNEPTRKIAAGGTGTYRTSASNGYVQGIRDRLRKATGQAGPGHDLILARDSDLDAFFNKQNPDPFFVSEPVKADSKVKPRRERKYTAPPFNADAYQVGHAHAQTADLMDNSKMGGNRPEIGT